MSEAELIRKYAGEIERIIRDNTMGDYTWNGLLFSFLRDVDAERSKPEPQAYKPGNSGYFDTVLGEAPVEEASTVDDDENKYYDVQVRHGNGWNDFLRRVTWTEAISISENLNVSTNVIEYDPNR